MKHLISLLVTLSLLRCIDLGDNLVRIEIVHHGTERDRFYVDARTGEASVAEVLLDDGPGAGYVLDGIAYEGILRYFLFFCKHDSLLELDMVT